MPINLTISADSVQEFDTLLARFSRSGATAAIMPEIAHTPAAQEAVAAAEPAKGNARSRKSAGADKATEAATTASAGTAGTSESGQSTSGSSASQTTEASTGAQSTGSAVDPFATPGTETVAATPSASSPADAAAAEAGEVTIQQLKDAMADLLKAKSASFAMQTLEQATGCKSLTSGSPSVVEKAKDDPTIFRKTLDALVAAKTAA